MKEKYKVIHESHARFLTASEYRLLLSINLHPGPVSIKKLSLDTGLDDNTIHRAKNDLFDQEYLTWTHETGLEALNVYDVKKKGKFPHPYWRNRQIIDTRSFEGCPAWACWFLAVMSSRYGFTDCPGKPTLRAMAKYCGVSVNTVSKYYSGLDGALDPNWMPNKNIIFNSQRPCDKVVDICPWLVLE